jgi:hypothetical protein
VKVHRMNSAKRLLPEVQTLAGADMSTYAYHHRTASPRPRRRETDRLLHRIREYVREAELLRALHAGDADVRARELEIRRLQEQLADVVRQDPIGGRDHWGRVRQGAHP